MAVTTVYELVEKRKRSEEWSRTGPVRKYFRFFRAVTDDQKDGPKIVLQAGAIPKLGNVYSCGNETDTGAWCINREANQTSGETKIWDVDVEYSSKLDLSSEEQSDPEQQENPLDRPTQIKGKFAQFQRSIDKDLDGIAVVNSARQPFDPPVVIDDSRPVIEMTRNEASLDFTLLATYQDAINQDTFLGFPPYTCKLIIPTFDQHFENGVFFWTITYEIHIRRELWHPLQVLDQGYYKLVAGSPEVITDANGKTLTAPRLLDGAGSPLASGASPVYMNFKPYKILPFAALSLP